MEQNHKSFCNSPDNDVLVSVIVPVYNVEKYIVRCIQSIIEQDFSDNIEIILVDDRGNDNSIQIITGYLESIKRNNRRYKIVTHKVNSGLSAARNTGIKHATGRYLYFLDSDDYLPKDAFNKLFTILSKFPDSDVIEGSTIAVDESYKTISERILNDHALEDFEIWDIRMKWTPIACNKILRRDWFIQNNLWFEEGIFHEDLYWSLSVANTGANIVTTSYATYFYLQRNESITHSFSEKHLISNKKLIQLFHTFFKSCMYNISNECMVATCENFRLTILDEVILKGAKNQIIDIINTASRFSVFPGIQILKNNYLSKSNKIKSYLLSCGWFGRLILKCYYNVL